MTSSIESIPVPLRSIITGASVGFLIGGGFHAIAGTTLRLAGRTTLTPSLILGQAGPAALRLSGVFASYTCIRSLLRDGGLIGASDSLSSAIAGGTVVSLVTAASTSRMELIRASLTRAMEGCLGGRLKGGIPKHLILVSAFVSGVCTLAGTDLLILKPFGLRW